MSERSVNTFFQQHAFREKGFLEIFTRACTKNTYINQLHAKSDLRIPLSSVDNRFGTEGTIPSVVRF